MNQQHPFHGPVSRTRRSIASGASLLALIAGCSSLSSEAQDIHFTQYELQPLLQSPAMAGVGHDLRAVLQHRNQWASVTTPFKTTAFSYDMQLKQKRGKAGYLAVGVNFFADAAGDARLRSTQGGLSAAYHIRTGEQSTIGAGLFGGFGQRSVDPGGLQWGAQYDGGAFNAALPTGENLAASSFTFVDLGLGGVWHFSSSASANAVMATARKEATIGLGYFHLTRPSYTFLGSEEQLNAKLVLHGRARLGIGEGEAALQPSFQYTRQGASGELMLGALLRYPLIPASKVTGINKGAAISVGPVLRLKDAVAIATLLEFGRMAVGMSYDINTSGLRQASKGRGAFELALRFVNPNPFNGRSRTRD